MKIRITQPGFEAFTGDFGVVPFVDGVSVNDVVGFEIDRLAASISIVDAASGAPIGVGARIIETHSDAAPVIPALPRLSDLETTPVPAPAPVDPTIPTFYTAEQLGDIADAGGIKAVREIAVKWDVRGKAINELIDEIVQAQDAWKKKRGIAASSEA